MEGLQCVGLLANTKKFDRLAGDLTDRQRGTTARLSELLNVTEISEVQDGIMSIVGESSVRE